MKIIWDISTYFGKKKHFLRTCSNKQYHIALFRRVWLLKPPAFGPTTTTRFSRVLFTLPPGWHPLGRKSSPKTGASKLSSGRARCRRNPWMRVSPEDSRGPLEVGLKNGNTALKPGEKHPRLLWHSLGWRDHQSISKSWRMRRTNLDWCSWQPSQSRCGAKENECVTAEDIIFPHSLSCKNVTRFHQLRDGRKGEPSHPNLTKTLQLETMTVYCWNTIDILESLLIMLIVGPDFQILMGYLVDLVIFKQPRTLTQRKQLEYHSQCPLHRSRNVRDAWSNQKKLKQVDWFCDVLGIELHGHRTFPTPFFGSHLKCEKFWKGFNTIATVDMWHEDPWSAIAKTINNIQ